MFGSLRMFILPLTQTLSFLIWKVFFVSNSVHPADMRKNRWNMHKMDQVSRAEDSVCYKVFYHQSSFRGDNEMIQIISCSSRGLLLRLRFSCVLFLFVFNKTYSLEIVLNYMNKYSNIYSNRILVLYTRNTFLKSTVQVASTVLCKVKLLLEQLFFLNK